MNLTGCLSKMSSAAKETATSLTPYWYVIALDMATYTTRHWSLLLGRYMANLIGPKAHLRISSSKPRT